MKGWYAAACAAAVFLGGCGAPSLPALSLRAGTVNARPGALHSWMSPGAARHDLLYVSDNAGVVYAFTYPGGKLAGMLTGFNGPAGLCSDGKGDVFVTNTDAEDVVEYAHGGRKPIATLSEFGAFPNGCAVDPKTGNLAVTNVATSPSQGPGNVAVYAKAKGSPTFYTAKNFNEYLFCGYDAGGNLFVDGVDAGTTQAQFAELTSGGSTLANVTLDTSVGYPGGVQWDGKDMAIEDLSKGDVDRVSFSGSTGTVVGTVHLNVRSRLLVQFWIAGSTIVVPYGALPRVARKVGLWSYPNGGKPGQTFFAAGDTELFGTTVSAAQ